MGNIRDTYLTKLNTTYHISRYNEETGDFETQTVHPIDETIGSIIGRFEDMANVNASLRERLTAISDERWKDEALQELNALLKKQEEDLNRGFRITAKEQASIDEWLKNHQHPSGAIGGTHSYVFTPTSIGIMGEIRCVCGKSYTFSDL